MQHRNLCFIFVVLNIFCQIICGQTLNDVRYYGTGIQIYAKDGGTPMAWYYLRRYNFEYPEGSVLCNNLTGNPLLDYERNFEMNRVRMARLDCDLGDVALSQCSISFQNAKARVNVTCLSSEGWNEGDIRLLPDGRILYLVKPTGSSLLVWAHFCFQNNSWNENITNLLCRGLGYQGVKAGGVQIEFPTDILVFGLKDFVCGAEASSYQNCTFQQVDGNGRCDGNDVIKIECDPIPPTTDTTTTMHISTTNPVSSGSTTNPVSSGSTTNPVSSGSTTNPVSSGSTTNPVSSGSTTNPVSSGSTTNPVSSGSTTNPVSSGSTTNPVSSGSTTNPVSSGSTTNPVSSGSTTNPVSSGSTTNPVSSGSTSPTSTLGLTSTTILNITSVNTQSTPTQNSVGIDLTTTQQGTMVKSDVTTSTHTTQSSRNESQIEENGIIKSVLPLLVALFVLMGVITGVVIVVTIIVGRKRSKRKNAFYANSIPNLGLSMIDNAETQINDSPYVEIDFQNQFPIREPSDYLSTTDISQLVGSFKQSNNYSIQQDENIYEGVLDRHNQFVLSSKERDYATIDRDGLIINPIYAPVQNEMYSTTSLSEDEYWEPGATIEGIYAQMSQYRYNEIKRSELVEGNKLGEGNFGLVMSGYWKTNGQSIPVAIKTLKIEDETSNIQFLQEAAILGQFHHANVLKLLGVVTISKPLYMVTEQMKTGLKNFLETIKQSGTSDFDLFSNLFLRLTNDIANGMQHLASKKFVHRDLAARNILLSHTLTCKISDFGLARHATENDEYYTSSGGKIPLKWTAPEAIFYKKYSEKSDVWSYGVTIYEVWTVGAVPWEGFSPDDLIERLSQGVILPPPSGCPRRVYKLMVDCWNPDNHARPSFNQIMESFRFEEGMFLDRGKDPLERMEFSLPPSRTERLFKDLQNRYITL